MHKNLAPICLFTYNRLEETKLTIESLQKNYLANQSKLYIFSDGGKNETSIKSVAAVREYLKQVNGFKEVIIIESKVNKGLANSIIEGVTRIINEYGKIIVMEDDLVTSSNFLSYMNEGLAFYESSKNIWSVSGFSFPIDYPKSYEFDNAFGVRASSWGWATWKSRWDLVDWDVTDYTEFLNDKKSRKAFNRGGSDMCSMLHAQRTGKINSWAIRFCYAQFKQQAYDILPVKSKVVNVGFNGDASNTEGMGTRFRANLDEEGKSTFTFNNNIALNEDVLKQFRKPLSISVRLLSKIKRKIKFWS
ncbi:hypothetical protein ACM9HF_03365 [Colwellia sp. RE-S-Sl-9]